MKAPKEPKPKMGTLERSILLRERGIKRMQARKAGYRAWAEERCAEVDKRIAQAKVLLDALKSGALKA